MHRLFSLFFLAGIAGAVVQLIAGDMEAPGRLINALWESADLAVKVSLGLIGVLALWSGLFRLAEVSRLADRISAWVTPVMARLMPGIARTPSAAAPVSMNLAANMLGLDNAATPLGLKAMEALQESNPSPRSATNSQIMFLVLNTSSVTLVPVTVLLFRAQQGAADPALVYLPLLMATTISTLVGVIVTARVQKLPLASPLLLGVVGIWLAVLGMLGAIVLLAPTEVANTFASLLGNGILLLVLSVFFIAAWRSGVDSYDAFVEGAKEGFTLAVRIIPYLVAMLAAIAMLRAGAMS